jgi:anti-anti-sigma factor
VSAETTCRFEELDRGVLAVTLRPELNEVPWTDIESIGSGIVSRVSAQAKPRVLVDLTELNHMGSAVVALVVRIWKAANEKDGKMVVVNRGELVGEVLEISGLANKWTIVTSRDAAISSFGGLRGSISAGEHSSRMGVVFVAIAAILLVLGILGLIDAVANGLMTDSLGKATTLWTGTGCALVALVVAAVAVAQTGGNLKLVAVVIATLAAVAAVAGVGLAMSPPARDAAPKAAVGDGIAAFA